MAQRIVFVYDDFIPWKKAQMGDAPDCNELWETRNLFNPVNPCLAAVRKIVFSKKVNRFLSFNRSVFARFFVTRSVLSLSNLRPDEVLVICSLTLYYYSDLLELDWVAKIFRKLLAERKVYFYLSDPAVLFELRDEPFAKFLPEASGVISFSKLDSEQRGFRFLPYAYVNDSSQHLGERFSNEPAFDFSILQHVFPGDGRLELADQLFKVASESGSRYIANVGSERPLVNFDLPENASLIDRHFEMRVGDVNCVVTVPRFGANYLTSTDLEALYYGRKILTTAKVHRDLPTFNPEFIKVIESPSEITPEIIVWMQERVPVKYENLDCISLDHFKRELRKIVEA